MTWTRQEFLADVARTGVLPPEYAEDVLVRLAHHAAAIEGNTLTLADTITLLVDERVPVAGSRCANCTRSPTTTRRSPAS